MDGEKGKGGGKERKRARWMKEERERERERERGMRCWIPTGWTGSNTSTSRWDQMETERKKNIQSREPQVIRALLGRWLARLEVVYFFYGECSSTPFLQKHSALLDTLPYFILLTLLCTSCFIQKNKQSHRHARPPVNQCDHVFSVVFDYRRCIQRGKSTGGARHVLMTRNPIFTRSDWPIARWMAAWSWSRLTADESGKYIVADREGVAARKNWIHIRRIDYGWTNKQIRLEWRVTATVSFIPLLRICTLISIEH